MTRAALASVTLPLSLVLGLLAAPVSCQCGSPLPHDHSLFILGDHRHDTETRQSDAHLHPSEHARITDDGPSNTAEVRAEGPTLRAPSDYSAGQPRSLALLSDVLSVETPERDNNIDDDRPSDGHSLTIDPPPPQT